MSVKFKSIARLLAPGLIGASLLAATAAHASYTAIDVKPVLDQNGQPVLDSHGNILTQQVRLDFGGYCDSENTFQNAVGQGCGGVNPFSGNRDTSGVYTLPYKVTFAPGETTNQILLRDSGQIDFIGDPLASPPDSTHIFDTFATVDTGISGGAFFAPQLANLAINGSSILATWFTCANPRTSCHVNVHTALLTPGADGFDITYTGGSGAGAPQFLAGTFDPAQTSGTPEPGVWALLLAGFAAVGAVLRRRRAGAAVLAG